MGMCCVQQYDNHILQKTSREHGATKAERGFLFLFLK
jgi:hypothetical protein